MVRWLIQPLEYRQYDPAAGTPCGTKPFIAPELYKGDPYSAETDLFAMGATLSYVWLNERLPYIVSDYSDFVFECADQINARMNRLCRSMRLTNPVGRPKEIDDLIEKGLNIYETIRKYFRRYEGYRRTKYDDYIKARNIEVA